MNKQAKSIWFYNGMNDKPNQFIMFRKSFECAKDVRSAQLDIYADSRYVLYINGQLAGRGPSPTDPRYPEYDTYDVCSLIKSGVNTIAVLVCYYGNQTASYIKTAPELTAALTINDADGNKHVFATDETWKCYMPVCWPISGSKRNKWRSLEEVFDAREYLCGWNETEYDDAGWMKPCIITKDYRASNDIFIKRLIPQLLYEREDAVEVYRSGKASFAMDPSVAFKYGIRDVIKEASGCFLLDRKLPVSIISGEKNEARYCIFDFKRDVAGRIGFRIKADAGSVIDIVFRESEEKDTIQISVRYLVNWKRYIARDGEQEWLSFEPEAFRYIQISVCGNKNPVEISEVYVIKQRYPSEARGNFCCSDEDYNLLWKSAANTIQLCMQEAYVDNPVREWGPWSGDIEFAKLPSYYVTGDCVLSARGLRFMSYGQERSGRMAMLWPAGLPFNASAGRFLFRRGQCGFEIPTHSLLWILSVWRHYMHSGDKELLKELFPKVLNALRYFDKRAEKDGLLNDHEDWEDYWDWMDWEGRKETWPVVNAYYYAAWHETEKMAKELSMQEVDREAVKRMKEIKQKYIEKYWSEEYACFVDCYTQTESGPEPFFSEHTLSTAIIYDLVPEGKNESVAERLAGGLPDSSPVFKYLPYIALSMNNQHEKVLGQFKSKWLKMRSISIAGTLQELWEMDENQGASFCQSASAVPAYYLPAHILGIRPLKPGFAEFIAEPVPAGLQWAKGAVPTPHGIISLEFKQDGDRYQFKVDVPDCYMVKERIETGNGLERRIYALKV